MDSADRWAGLRQRALALLQQNLVVVPPHRYTRPAPSVYEHQWLWDSCFHAIVYRWLDPAMAADELLSVVQHQVAAGPDEGMIPHMTYWRGGGEALWGIAERSVITQPPLIAVAARLLAERGGPPALLGQLYEPLCAYHAWFDRRRDPDGDDLVALIHPWESGWDAAPRWDAAMGLDRPSDEASRVARKELAATLRRYACDAAALAEAGFFHVEAIDYNAIRAADLEALAWLAAELGHAAESAHWSARAQAVRRAVGGRLLQPGPRDLAGPDETPITAPSAAPFVALFGGCADAEQADALHAALGGAPFWTPYPIATTPRDDPDFGPDRYWRGNVWLNVNWLIMRGLRRYGYAQTAAALAERSIALVEHAGFWEYYHPISGQGYGSFPHSWSAIVLDMALGG